MTGDLDTVLYGGNHVYDDQRHFIQNQQKFVSDFFSFVLPSFVSTSQALYQVHMHPSIP